MNANALASAIRPIHTRPNAVIFDLDGVLIDSMPYYYEAWSASFLNFGIDITEKEIYQREGEKSKTTAGEIFKKYKHEFPDEDTLDLIIKLKDEHFNKIFEPKLMSGAEELLEELHRNQVKIGLVTGSRDPRKKLQNRKDLLEYFDVIVTGNDIEKGKPCPDPYLKAIEKLGSSNDESIVVENAPLGIKSAVSAGIKCLVLRSCPFISDQIINNLGATCIFNTLEDIRKYLIGELISK